jgi:hypothetical protein
MGIATNSIRIFLKKFAMGNATNTFRMHMQKFAMGNATNSIRVHLKNLQWEMRSTHSVYSNLKLIEHILHMDANLVAI